MTAVKICCIRDRREVELALSEGASVLGFVGQRPLRPGRLEDDTIAELIGAVDGRVPCWLLSTHTDPETLAAQIARTRPDAVQLCDRVDEGIYAQLRHAFPGLELIQVIHVGDDSAAAEARRVAPHVDGLLLDSGRPGGELGGTGETHDWAISERIVAQAPVPVWLAGGLTPDNVGPAIRHVKPHGVDLCSGVRDDDYRLDGRRLRAFLAAVQGAGAAIVLPGGASLADLQRYIHELEAHHGWLANDLVMNAFLMTEEVGELHAALREVRRVGERGDPEAAAHAREAAGEEIVDVLNYLLALANRLELDLEAAFRSKNARNQDRSWD